MVRAIRFQGATLLVLVGIVVWAASGARADETLLRWRFEPGQTYTYRMTQTSNSKTSGTGNVMQLAVENALTVKWSVDSVNDGVAQMTQTVEQFASSMSVNGADPIAYDSSSKTPSVGAAREIATAASRVVGLAMKVTMTDRGEIQSVTLAPAPAVEGASRPQNDELKTVIPLLQQSSILLPESKIDVGHTWEVKQEVPTAVGKIVQVRTWKYTGVEEVDGAPGHVLELNAVFDAASAAALKDVKIKTGEVTGKLRFDNEQGRLVGGELQQTLVTERPYRDRSIRVESKSGLKVELLP